MVSRQLRGMVYVTSWLYAIILWAVVGIAFAVLLYIDGIFSRSLAPASIEPLSFQAMGWAYRFFAASFLMAAARCAMKDMRRASGRLDYWGHLLL